MKAIILVLNEEDDWEFKQPHLSERSTSNYKIWGDICIERGIQLVRSCSQWWDGENFLKYWDYKDRKWLKKEGKIFPTIVYDKCLDYNRETGELDLDLLKVKQSIQKKIELLNYWQFELLFRSKLNQAVIFSEWLPKTKFLKSPTTLKNADKLKIVLKPLMGSGGYGIKISDERSIKIGFDCIVQGFIKSNPTKEIRDTRLVFLGEEIVYSFSREADHGSLFTNLHQGGRITFNKLSDVDKSLIHLGKIISKKIIDVFPKAIYALDFMYDFCRKKYYLVELNNKPGLDAFDKGDSQIAKNFFEKLTRYLLQAHE